MKELESECQEYLMKKKKTPQQVITIIHRLPNSTSKPVVLNQRAHRDVMKWFPTMNWTTNTLYATEVLYLESQATQ